MQVYSALNKELQRAASIAKRWPLSLETARTWPDGKLAASEPATQAINC
jgi:hypothetical protein